MGRLLSPQRAATIFGGLCADGYRELAKSGVLCARYTPGGHLRFDEGEIVAFWDSQRYDTIHTKKADQSDHDIDAVVEAAIQDEIGATR